VVCRKFVLVTAALSVLLHAWQSPVFCQEIPTTADQVIANYLLAIGGSDKIASITTFAEKGELTGNLDGFGRGFVPPTMRTDHGTFESYFKAPNFRFSVLHRDNAVSTMHGCDGAVSWYIGGDAVSHEFKPKPGSEYECKKGYEPMPLVDRAPNVRIQLKGKKKIGGRLAWAVRADDPKSSSTDTFYFDAETYLLLEWETVHGIFKIDHLYSDYRDVGGIKLAFMIVQRTDNTSLATILRDVEINAPIDDARFYEPKILGGPKHPQVVLETPSKSPEVRAESAPAAQPKKIDVPDAVSLPEAHIGSDSVHVATTNFVSSSVEELQQMVPELRGLKAAESQQDLSALLDKIGDRTVELSRKIPNLMAHEEIVESRPGSKETRESFSYLILARRSQDAITLEEFRVDLDTGATFETDEAWKPGASVTSDPSSHWEDLARASQRISARATGGPPLNQGFASMWLHFHPSNRAESTFRYLGQQKINGHHTFVVAFAQKPGSVRLPGEVRFEDKSLPIYYEGIAWVDASDFRILRLRTDLLPVATELPLTQLTAEVQFADTQAAGFSSPLWLPREVAVTSEVNGHIFHDKHTYSNYRSFQAHAKILLDP
jgi:hypothetical protein